MNKHKYNARWSERVTDPTDKRAQVNIRLHPVRRDELARLHQVTRSRMIEALIQKAWQTVQGGTIERGQAEQSTPASNRPATGQGKSMEQLQAEMERDGLIVQ